MSEVPDPSGRNAPTPTHNKNKGRKVRTFGNNSNKPKAGIALCRRDWIIVLNTRRSQLVWAWWLWCVF